MFSTYLETFKTQEKELLRQASHDRLVRSLEQNNSLTHKIYKSLGRMLILSGQYLLNNARVAAN